MCYIFSNKKNRLQGIFDISKNSTINDNTEILTTPLIKFNKIHYNQKYKEEDAMRILKTLEVDDLFLLNLKQQQGILFNRKVIIVTAENQINVAKPTVPPTVTPTVPPTDTSTVTPIQEIYINTF